MQNRMLKFFKWKIGRLIEVRVSRIIVFFVDTHIFILQKGKKMDKYMKLTLSCSKQLAQ